MKKVAYGAVSVFFCFMCMVAGVTMVARAADSPPDSLLVNAGSIIGQPLSIAEERGFPCALRADLSPDEINCVSYPVSGAASEIRMSISRNAVQEVAVTVRQDRAKIGHLLRLWGAPLIETRSNHVYLRWRERGITAIAWRKASPFSVSFPVWTVYFTNPESHV